MRFALPLAFVVAPALAVSAIAAEPEKQDTETTVAETAATKDADQKAEEDKRICRYVRLDMSSRRKERVCRTASEWREINQPR